MGASHISMDMSLLEAFDRASKDTEAILDEDEDDDVKVQLVAEESLQVVEESQPEVPAAQSEPPFIGANESQGLPPATKPLDANGRSYPRLNRLRGSTGPNPGRSRLGMAVELCHYQQSQRNSQR